MTKRFNAFTLAEVLITLGIIGVVAAMTMPTLINQTNGAQYKAAYKKALSAISQGVTLNVALDGNSFADTTSVAQTVAVLTDRMNVIKGANEPTQVGYPTSGSGVATFAGDGTDGSGNYTLFFNDGIVFQFDGTNAFGCRKDAVGSTAAKLCKGFIDVNGLKGPNKEVKCDDGTTNSTSCTVSNPTDIYPVVFYDQTIMPNSWAARAVMYGK